MRAFAIAAGLVFAAFVTAKGIPTLRHDWTWPLDAAAIPSFFRESIGGWLSTGFGALNAHPTTYLISIPIAAAMWLLTPLGALALFAIAIGYVCACGAFDVSRRWNVAPQGAVGIALFALFNPWVYNEVVAGHLVMVLAYGGMLGLFAEMLRGGRASSVRLALWLVLVESQLQFFVLAMIALAIFAFVTKKWLPFAAGLVLGLPSAVGLVAERTMILKTPYVLEWQANQSVAPGALSALGGYFPGYADRLGLAAAIAVWMFLALAAAGAVAQRRRRAALAALAAAVLLYLAIAGTHGLLAVPYAWIVQQIPESGVFRELYDLAGIFAALIAVLACAAIGTISPLRYAALAAGLALPVTWLVNPPSDLWVGAASYPHPSVAATPFVRVALLPAFQPLALRDGRGGGADPDVYVYPGHVAAINEYFPTYPVNMALARYERTGDVAALRALGVAEILPRPWLESRSNGNIGLAASSLARAQRRFSASAPRYVRSSTPLISACVDARIVAVAGTLDGCDVFFGDAGGDYPAVAPFVARSTSIDPRTDWIDARLAFADEPSLAQGLGGVVTQSRVPHSVEPGSPLLAYLSGRLSAPDGRTLASTHDGFSWIEIPNDVTSVVCDGLCELVAQAPSVPNVARGGSPEPVSAVPFREIQPWLYVVSGSPPGTKMMRLNERYDAGWTALRDWHVLPHVRVNAAANGWLFGAPSSSAIILVQVTSLLQIAAEVCGIACLLWLLKAVAREPTKRVS